MLHPWHELSPGDETPEIVVAFIEIPKRSHAKYELDKESGLIRLDRMLYSSVYYPANYGFIPKSYCDDKDPLDILVLCQEQLPPGCLVRAKVVGVMQMLDQGEADDKIIAVADDDISVNHINDINDVPAHFRREMLNFFEDYKKLEKKEVKVEDFQGKEEALTIVEKAFADYKDRFVSH